MNGLKILVSLIGVFVVFSFTNVNAMEKNSSKLSENKSIGKNDEELAPIKIKGGCDGIIFNLSDEKVADLYKNENACSKREVEQWFLNGVVIRKENKISNKNSILYYTESGSLHKIEYLLKNYVRRLKLSLIDQVFDAVESNLTMKQQFVNLIYNLFEKYKFYLRYEDLYNFKYTKRFNGRVVIIFEGMTKEEKEFFENVKNSTLCIKNLEDIRVLRDIRAFLQFFMDIFFHGNEKKTLPLVDQEYSTCFNIPERLNFCSEKVKYEIMPYITKNMEEEGIKFNGKNKDFNMFYKLAYNRVLNIEPKEGSMINILFNRSKFRIDLYNPVNVEYVKLSDDWLKVTFKFKNNENVKKELFYLLEFELRNFEDPGAILSKQIILSYINQMKEKKIKADKIKKENVIEEGI